MQPKVNTFVTPEGVSYTRYQCGSMIYISASSCDAQALDQLSQRLEQQKFTVTVLPVGGSFMLDGEKARK